MNLNNMMVKFTQDSGEDFFSGKTVNYNQVGKIVEVSDWDPNPSYSGGIHFARADVAFATLGRWLLQYYFNRALGAYSLFEPFRQQINFIQRVFQVEAVESGEVIEILQNGKPTGDFKAKRVRIIKELDLPQVFSWLSKKESWIVRFLAACHCITPTEDLNRLSKSKIIWIQKAVAGNPNTSLSILKKIAEDRTKKNSIVLESLALNPTTSERILLKLSRRISWLRKTQKRVKEKIAGLKRVSLEALRALAEDEDPELRAMVAANPKTDEKILLNLAEDHEFIVINTIACRAEIPESVTKRLVQNKAWLIDFSSRHYGVKMNFVKNQNLSSEVMVKIAEATFLVDPKSKKGECASVIRHVMANFRDCPHTPLEVLTILAQDKENIGIVVGHPNTSFSLYKRIANQPHIDYFVASGVASSPYITSEIARRLIAHRDFSIARELLGNPKLPFALEFLLEILKPSPLYRTIIQGNREEVRRIAKIELAYRKDTPLKIRKELTEDLNFLVREAVAQSPHTPRALLKGLLRDEEWLVSRAALKNLKK